MKYLVGYASTYKRQLYSIFQGWQILILVVYFAPVSNFSIHLLFLLVL